MAFESVGLRCPLRVLFRGFHLVRFGSRYMANEVLCTFVVLFRDRLRQKSWYILGWHSGYCWSGMAFECVGLRCPLRVLFRGFHLVLFGSRYMANEVLCCCSW
jgi:hypothetical protein